VANGHEFVEHLQLFAHGGLSAVIELEFSFPALNVENNFFIFFAPHSGHDGISSFNLL